ncbi:MAG: ATP-binding protein [Thermodesulfobacteriota bacterium]|nr:ATP-binding protein [Thermodesulfobacteriota bacterium]
MGRKQELHILEQLIQSDSATIGVIYGRRRIGKSELIRKGFEKYPTLSFEGLENRPKQEQIDNFLFQLAYQRSKKNKIVKVHSWKEAFLLLYEELLQNPAHIVFDEFQWMANYRSEIVSDLKLIWDQYISQIRGTTLILCGSIASFMTGRVIKSNALYGRTDLVIHLKGFLLPETKQMLHGKGDQEIIEAQMLLGGVPKYLDLIREKPSVRLGMENLAFSETGYLTDEYDRIFLSHFGRNKEYEKIIKILASHPYGLFRKEIAQKARIELGGGLTTHLKNLESAGFISSATPFHKGHNSRLLKYYLSDAYLRFYFSFIQPNLKKIKSGIHRDLFSRICQSGSFYAWMGRAFEYLCMEHARKISEILGFSGIDFTCGPYFVAATKNITGVQIDLLFSRRDNVMTLCEMKYSLGPGSTALIDEVERKAAILQSAFKGKTIQKVLISRSRPTKNLAATGYFYRIIHPEQFFSQAG